MPDTGSPFNLRYPGSTAVPDVPGDIYNLASDVHNELAGSYRYVDTVYFTSSGTFTKADYPWLRAIRVRCVGGGGSGGGTAATGAGQWSASGGGGGGAYGESFITDIASLDASTAVTVGAGGAAPTAGGAGTPGGASSFSDIVIAAGGLGANAESAVNFPYNPLGGYGGSSVTADLGLRGQNGSMGSAMRAGSSNRGGHGGQAGGLPGMQGAGGSNDVGGPALANSGGGGGGSASDSGVVARSAGAGGSGIVIIDLFA